MSSPSGAVVRDGRPSAGERRIDDCFREQARLFPDATALVDGDRRITYGELHERAVEVARGLVARGVGRETPVAMAFERSAEAVVAMLGILLAGGAYLPLNPGWPARRVAQILEAARPPLLLCADGGGEGLAEIPPCTSAHELSDIALPSGDPFAFAPPQVRPGSSPLAYIMFTSGSTGTPKGVMVEHRGVVRLVKDTDYLDFSSDRRFAHCAALEFDASTLEVWGPLLNGGSLCVIDTRTAVVPALFGRALRSYGVTTCWLTAPLFHQLADEDPEIFAPLTDLLTGGDVVSPDHVNRVLARNPGLRVHNGYGPTENTTFTAVHTLDRPHEGPIPIGLPVRGTTVSVRDERGGPVPSGTVGELWAAGDGLARGYLGQHDLTGQRFVLRDGIRHYRTGDRVHMDEQGLLHFHGRRDGQVKISGNLVDVAEVNAAFVALPGVLDAYTRAVGGPTEDKHLIAHVAAPGLDEDVVRAGLRGILPAFMHPRHVVLVDRLPLGPTGKVDWRALPVPPAFPARAPAAQTPGQQRLAALWADVLNVSAQSIAADDDFFALGGNSIRLGTLIGRIGRELDVALPPAEAFAASTLAAMSAAVERAPGTTLPDIPRLTEGCTVALHPAQRALHALWEADPGSLVYNVPVRIDIRGPLEPDQLRTAFAGTVARHDALRMGFVIDDEGVRQTPADCVAPEFTYHDAPSPQQVAAFVRPFHPGESPLIRALLTRQGDDRHELYIDVHHVVFDGVSLRLLVTEILDRYAGVTPAAPTVRYAEAAQWAHDALTHGARADDEVYWLRRLTDAPASKGLPTDRPRGPHRATVGKVLRRGVGRSRTDAVMRTARRHSTTPFAVLLTAYFAALARVLGYRDLIVGSPVTGRDHPDLDATIGMFVNTVCLRAVVGEEESYGSLLRRISHDTREALAHQSYPFERLVDRLELSRDPARNPLFDAYFALQNIDFHTFRRGGLDLAVDVLNPGITRFDLNLQAYQRPSGLVLDLEYASDLYERSTAEHLLRVFLGLLDGLAENPHRPVLPPRAVAPVTDIPDFDF